MKSNLWSNCVTADTEPILQEDAKNIKKQIVAAVTEEHLKTSFSEDELKANGITEELKPLAEDDVIVQVRG